MIKTHRPCLALAVIFAFGIMAGKFILTVPWIWLLASIIAGIVFLFKRSSWSLFLIVFGLGAVWFSQSTLLAPDNVAFLDEKNVQDVEAIEGIVVSDIVRQYKIWGELIRFEFDIKKILVQEEWKNTSGKVQVNGSIAQEDEPSYGDHLRVKGYLKPVFDGDAKSGFSYREYMQAQGVYWAFKPGNKQPFEVLARHQGNFTIAWAMRIRHEMENVFYKYLTQAEAGFVSALVLGDKADMPKDLKAIFVNTGTAHILAISGMNMAVIAAVFFFMFRASSVARKWQYVLTIVFLFAYAFLSGWSASVVRACIMSAVILASFAFEYEGEALNSLGLAALILLLLDARNLFDVGFQLSFAAVAGILTLTKHCEKFFCFLPSFIRVSMAISLAAWAGTFPLTLYRFHILTPISILANIPIVPLADLVMVLGLGLAACGFIPYLGYIFAACLKAILSLMVIFATWFSQIPYGHFSF